MGRCGCGKVEQGTGIREEVVSGVFSVDAGFEGVSNERDILLGEWKWISSGDLRWALAPG